MPDAASQPGVLVLVVGPSGAGKDTLIEHARAAFAGEPLSVARRIVTRPASSAEAHDTLDADAFAEAAAQGRFAFRWEAHGLHYAIPGAVETALGRGEAVICNVSRGVVADLRSRYPQVLVVYVDAPLAVRQARVAGRQRADETPERARRTDRFTREQADCVVDNDGRLEDACLAFEGFVATALDRITIRRVDSAET